MSALRCEDCGLFISSKPDDGEVEHGHDGYTDSGREMVWITEVEIVTCRSCGWRNRVKEIAH